MGFRARLLRGSLAVLVAGALVVPLTGAGRAGTPAPVPPRLPALADAPPAARYAANRDAVRDAARAAASHGDRERATALWALAAPGRRLLAFDGRGNGRIVEVLGDLPTARRVAVLVPGSGTTIETYDPAPGTANPAKALAGAARSLYAVLRRHGSGGGDRTAVVAWLGYDAPATVGTAVLGTVRADQGAGRLQRFLEALHTAWPAQRVALLCHSYGSVVCGRAADGLDGTGVRDVVFYGSPGTGVADADALGTDARVWAGRGADDWIAHVPHTAADLLGTGLGLGPDPTSHGYGADLFPAGAGGHSDYLRPGSVALRSLAALVHGGGGRG